MKSLLLTKGLEVMNVYLFFYRKLSKYMSYLIFRVFNVI